MIFMLDKLIKLLFFCLLFLSFSFAIVAVNSLDSRDVISATYYAAVTNDKIVILYPNYDADVFYKKIGVNNNVLLIQSSQKPVVAGVADILTNKGNTVQIFLSDDPYETNLKLAEKSGAQRFIIVDPLYGYNVVSCLAYAKLNGMYLIFANKENIDSVKENIDSVVKFLQTKKPKEILVYGYVDEEVKNNFSNKGISYSEINKGDKFLDNMELLDRYFKQNPSKKQVVLADGNGIEDTIADGNDPVLFIGTLIPMDVYNYLKQKINEGQINVGLVVDNDYVQAAYNLKQSLNKELGEKKFNVLVKIGQSAAGEGTPNPVPILPLRAPIVGLAIEKVEYNTATKALEVTYVNKGNAPEYVKSNLIVFVNNNRQATLGDEEPFLLSRDAKLGKSYPVNVEEGEIVVNITSLYGLSKRNLDNGIAGMFVAGKVNYVDNSALAISDISYNANSRELLVTFINNGIVPVFFKADLELKGSASIKMEDDKVYYLNNSQGRTITFVLPSTVTSNDRVIVGANYGVREAFLNKRVEKEYALAAPTFSLDANVVYLLLILLLIAIIVYLVMKNSAKNKK